MVTIDFLEEFGKRFKMPTLICRPGELLPNCLNQFAITDRGMQVPVVTKSSLMQTRYQIRQETLDQSTVDRFIKGTKFIQEEAFKLAPKPNDQDVLSFTPISSADPTWTLVRWISEDKRLHIGGPSGERLIIDRWEIEDDEENLAVEFGMTHLLTGAFLTYEITSLKSNYKIKQPGTYHILFSQEALQYLYLKLDLPENTLPNDAATKIFNELLGISSIRSDRYLYENDSSAIEKGRRFMKHALGNVDDQELYSLIKPFQDSEAEIAEMKAIDDEEYPFLRTLGFTAVPENLKRMANEVANKVLEESRKIEELSQRHRDLLFFNHYVDPEVRGISPSGQVIAINSNLPQIAIRLSITNIREGDPLPPLATQLFELAIDWARRNYKSGATPNNH